MNQLLFEIEHKMKAACLRSNRQEKEVTLIAVSKTKPVAMIKQAYSLGIRDFGENKVQELVEKREQLPDDIKWHMIGHLQRNKVKYIAPFVHLIHGVDSAPLAYEIDKQAQKNSRIIPILIEVNVGEEESKFGVKVEDAEKLIREISVLSHIKIHGLMCVPPITTVNCDNRKYFQMLKQLSVDIRSKNIDNVDMDILSMGMTDDYEIAIEEGATYIRVGTGLFGKRLYKVEGER